LSPTTIADFFEQQNLPLVVGQASILQTHQRHQFSIFVNGVAPSVQLAPAFQVIKKCSKVGKIVIGS
jgi:hypothetical protein